MGVSPNGVCGKPTPCDPDQTCARTPHDTGDCCPLDHKTVSPNGHCTCGDSDCLCYCIPLRYPCEHGAVPVNPHGVHPYCINGGHPVEPGVRWRKTRASFNGERWIQNPNSGAAIIACVDHPVPPQVHIHQGGTTQTYCGQPLRLDAAVTNVSWEQASLSTCPVCRAHFQD